jgi:hypothetical protein
VHFVVCFFFVESPAGFHGAFGRSMDTDAD